VNYTLPSIANALPKNIRMLFEARVNCFLLIKIGKLTGVGQQFGAINETSHD
jgi:hypothetical protein